MNQIEKLRDDGCVTVDTGPFPGRERARTGSLILQLVSNGLGRADRQILARRYKLPMSGEKNLSRGSAVSSAR